MDTSQLDDFEERQRVKNKKRLLTQNLKLNQEIRKLEVEMGEIMQNRQAQVIEGFEKTNSELTKKR